MILSGHQPNYWPYPGLIGKIMKSDRFVFVTKVQFEKKKLAKKKSGKNQRCVDIYSSTYYYKGKDGTEYM